MRLSPETCRVKPLRRIKTQLLHLVGLISLQISDSELTTPRASHGVSLGSALARFLELGVRFPPVAWIFFSCGFCVLSEVSVRVDHSSRGVLPNAVRLSVISFNSKIRKTRHIAAVKKKLIAYITGVLISR